jgi:hypothetical protein
MSLPTETTAGATAVSATGFTTTVLACTAALVAGVGIGRVTSETPHNPPVTPPSELASRSAAPEAAGLDCDWTDEDLRIACIPVMRRTASSLEEVQTRVDALSVQVASKEYEVQRLEIELASAKEVASVVAPTRVAPPEPADPAAFAQLIRAKEELAALQAQLQEALKAQGELDVSLTQTRAALATSETNLARQRKHTEQSREDLVRQKWLTFVNDAQLTICAEGTKSQVERCRTVVASTISPYERHFMGCVRSGQAIPEVLTSKPGENLPTFAVRLDNAEGIGRNWHILFCDPDLPETKND